eukprot:jgi/Ulvmu1/12480/UM009_0133.1
MRKISQVVSGSSPISSAISALHWWPLGMECHVHVNRHASLPVITRRLVMNPKLPPLPQNVSASRTERHAASEPPVKHHKCDVPHSTVNGIAELTVCAAFGTYREIHAVLKNGREIKEWQRKLYDVGSMCRGRLHFTFGLARGSEAHGVIAATLSSGYLYLGYTSQRCARSDGIHYITGTILFYEGRPGQGTL